MRKEQKRLIVNADDFGLHPLVNAGIVEGHKAGCITSTSLMPGGAAFTEAVALAKEIPDLGIGIHLTLVGGEKPLCQPEEIPSLVAENNCFAADYGSFLQKYFTGKIRRKEIEIELRAQVEKAMASGLSITHIDSHQHMHVVPGIVDIVIRLAQEYEIKAVRIPSESYFFFGKYPCSLGRFLGRGALSLLAKQSRYAYAKAGLSQPDHFFGMLAGGSLLPEYFLEILKSLPEGTSEIMIHPGKENQKLSNNYPWRYHWQDELAAVLQEENRLLLAKNNIELISFKELLYE
ncbi:MAG: ChbG/HpnK family deacetylase [Sporomusaceae bacterium]|nr:ChbG/HpnK family deacetylase [Sporomusaceae bacterium]